MRRARQPWWGALLLVALVGCSESSKDEQLCDEVCSLPACTVELPDALRDDCAKTCGDANEESRDVSAECAEAWQELLECVADLECAGSEKFIECTGEAVRVEAECSGLWEVFPW